MTDTSSPPTRAAIALGIFVVGALLGWLGRGLLVHPDDVAFIATYDDWRLACPKSTEQKATCQMAQEVIDGKTHREVARIVRGKEDDKEVMAITVPFNVLLASGIKLAVGSEPAHSYPYQTCTNIGCLAIISPDDQLASSLRDASKAEITFTGLDGRAATITFSVKGFKQADDAYADAEAKRHSWWRRLWS